MECAVCGMDHNQPHDSELWTTKDHEGEELSLDRLSNRTFEFNTGEPWHSDTQRIRVTIEDLRRLRDAIDELDSEF